MSGWPGWSSTACRTAPSPGSGRPAIILADEPTGSLDSATGAGILTLLGELNRRGATILVVTHNPEIAAAARRVIRLRDGRVEHDSGAG